MKELIITYAGNLEDVILYHLLKNAVGGGIYVDVGANDPIKGNVTKLFYDFGWNGINIDPIKSVMDMYYKLRKRDVNLAVGCSDIEGELEYMEAGVFSSFNPNNYAGIREYCRKHNLECSMCISQVRTLKNILDEYADKKEIYFLKIDVENYETHVLNGMDFNVYRPWIICVEAQEQFTAQPIFDWEHVLIEHGYTFELTIQGNRYYIANEHSEIRDKLNVDVDFEKYLRLNYDIYKVDTLKQIELSHYIIGKINSVLQNKIIRFLTTPIRKQFMKNFKN